MSDYGTGSIFREPDLRDWQLHKVPGMPAALAQPLVAPFTRVPLDKIPYIYDQQQTQACVAFSPCAVKSIEDYLDDKQWNVYDALEIYHACGGPEDGSRGIYTDTALGYIRDVGCLDQSTRSRFKISGYAFASQIFGVWRQELMAAVKTFGPCVVAALLPQNFGWDSSGLPTSAYHQLALVDATGLEDTDYAIFQNSWSRYWGHNGFGRLTWGYLEGNGFQNGYCYGAKMIDADDLILPPPPPPPIVPVIKSVKVKKTGRKLIVTGTFSADITAQIDDAIVAPNVVEENWLRFTGSRLSRGAHQLVITDGGVDSAPFTFSVE